MLANLSSSKRPKNWILLTVGLFFILLLIAANTLHNKLPSAFINVSHLSQLLDANNQYDINSVQKVPSTEWQNIHQQSLTLGLVNDVFWFSFSLPDTSAEQAKLLQIDYPLLDNLSIWFVSKNQVLAEHHAGDDLAFSQRALADKSFLFPVPNTAQPLTIFIRINTDGALHLPVKLWEHSDFLEFNSRNNLILGLFFGLMLAMGLCYFFLFVTSRSITFLLYSAYVVCLGLTLASLSGLGYQYLWPNFPWLQQHALGIFASLSLCLAVIFCQQLLQVKDQHQGISKVLTFSVCTIIFGLLLSLIVPLNIFIQSFVLILCLVGMLELGIAIWLWYRGVHIAILFTFSWAILFGSSLLVCLNSLNVIQLNIPSHYPLMLGATVEAMMLALILAISHNQQRQSLLATQVELLEREQQAQSSQKAMLALQENATEQLEYKVQERTLELEIALRELSDINQELEQKNTLDALTGIRNRRYFDKKYQAEVRRSRREQTQLSIVMIDIDHFKKVNDVYGHLIGDECIKLVANTISKALKRPSDDVCRYGGEEFALILPHTDLAGALALLEQLRMDIQNTSIQADNVSIHITISAGVACAVAELNQPEDAILALADKQLYLAKNAGRNNVQGRDLNATQDQE